MSLKGGTLSGISLRACAALRAASSAFATARASAYDTPSRMACKMGIKVRCWEKERHDSSMQGEPQCLLAKVCAQDSL